MFVHSCSPQDLDTSLGETLQQANYNFWPMKEIKKSLSHNHNFLLYGENKDKQVLGWSFWQIKSEKEAELLYLFIHQKFRRMNYGEKLFNLSIQRIKQKESGLQLVLLEVSEANQAAIKLYQKLGFSEDGLRKNYYRAGEACINMSLRISNCSSKVPATAHQKLR